MTDHPWHRYYQDLATRAHEPAAEVDPCAADCDHTFGTMMDCAKPWTLKDIMATCRKLPPAPPPQARPWWHR